MAVWVIERYVDIALTLCVPQCKIITEAKYVMAQPSASPQNIQRCHFVYSTRPNFAGGKEAI